MQRVKLGSQIQQMEMWNSDEKNQYEEFKSSRASLSSQQYILQDTEQGSVKSQQTEENNTQNGLQNYNPRSQEISLQQDSLTSESQYLKKIQKSLFLKYSIIQNSPEKKQPNQGKKKSKINILKEEYQNIKFLFKSKQFIVLRDYSDQKLKYYEIQTQKQYEITLENIDEKQIMLWEAQDFVII